MNKRFPLSTHSGFILALGVAVFFVHVQAEAYVLSGYRWPGSHPWVPFYVSTNCAGNVPYDAPLEDGIRAITNAAHTWNTQGGSNLKFYFAGLTDVTNVANDGMNVIIYDPEACSSNPGCLGMIVYHNVPDIFYEGFDIVLNGKRSDGLQLAWSAKDLPRIWERDIESIVLHEFGHAAGLLHSDITQTVMGSIPGNGSRARNLKTDDAWGIQAIYGPYSDEGIWASNPAPAPGETVTLHLDYPQAARQQYQIVADFDGLIAGCALRDRWQADSRIFPLDRCPHPMGSRSPTPLEQLVLPANIGVLDSNGQARVTVQIPETLSCFPTNRRWHFSVVTHDPNLTPSGIEDVGVAVALDIQPPPGPRLHVRLPGASQAELRWEARANYAYQMEHSTTLTDWTALGPLLAAPLAGGWLTGLVSLAQSPEFFRVQALALPDLPCSGVLLFVTSTNHLRVPEGGTASFTVQLTGRPANNVAVSLARSSGDRSLVVDGDDDHRFRAGNWNEPKTFTIRASQDADATNGVATFTLIGDGLDNVVVTAEEADDDSP